MILMSICVCLDLYRLVVMSFTIFLCYQRQYNVLVQLQEVAHAHNYIFDCSDDYIKIFLSEIVQSFYGLT